MAEVLVDQILLNVLAVAETQHSVITLDDMRKCGANKTWVHRHVQTGFIVRLGPSTYGIAGVRRAFPARAMAAVLSVWGPVLVSHRSAAHLHGFERVLEFTWWDMVHESVEVRAQVAAANESRR
jgi:predicted transcriptional regulator of viral defense system